MALPAVDPLVPRGDMYQALRVLVSGRELQSGVAEAMDATFELEDPILADLRILDRHPGPAGRGLRAHRTRAVGAIDLAD